MKKIMIVITGLFIRHDEMLVCFEGLNVIFSFLAEILPILH